MYIDLFLSLDTLLIKYRLSIPPTTIQYLDRFEIVAEYRIPRCFAFVAK